MAAYKIGNFTFDTEDEYARGLEDAKKIEKIQSTVDLNEPETALRLYWLIRTGKIKFGSKVGKKFFLDIADAVAKSAAKNMTQAQAPEQQAGEEPRQGAQDRSRKILGAVCVTAAFLCFGWYFWSDYTNHRGSQANEYLKMLKEEVDKLKGIKIEEEKDESSKPLIEVETHISNEYAPDDEIKLEVHKLINNINSEEDIDNLIPLIKQSLKLNKK